MKSSYTNIPVQGRLRRALLLLGLLAPLALACAPGLQAAIAQSVNYQGFLLSKVTNLPVETPQDITFLIYPGPSGGSPLFTESRCNVGVTKGRYDVEVGSASGGIPGNIFAENQNLWLEIQVDPDGSCSGTYEAMTPRIRLQAAPYAFNSLYASTASAATPLFSADVIGALPQTTNGAITISSNLFVQGGISVGDISPGQQLSVAGMVVSKGVWPACSGNGTCGFKFPDDTIQYTAAANTMWEGGAADSLHNINGGNVGLGEFSDPPLARLHVSSAIGDAGDLLLVSTGTYPLFRVTGLGQVYGGQYYGDGSTLAGVVAEGGDTMTGQLTLAGSSLTVTSAAGMRAPKLKFRDNVEISSASAAQSGGVLISTHVRLMAGAILYGDGGGLTNVVTLDSTKVSTAGGTMSGQLTLGFNPATVAGSSLTVTGDGLVLGRLNVNGSVTAVSSITAQGGLYASTLNSAALADLQNVRASTGTFWGYSVDDPDPNNRYSVMTASGIKVNAGKVVAPAFVGDGSQLTNVAGTDSDKLSRHGGLLDGHLLVSPSSVTIFSSGENQFGLVVATAASVEKYAFAVSTAGNVGIQVYDPTSPLTVYSQIGITAENDDVPVSLDMRSNFPSYIRWSNAVGNLGVMGYRQHVTTRDFVFQAMGSNTGNGTEVFHVQTDAGDNTGATWKFGVGITPAERFHVGANMLVSNGASPILSVSTTTEQVGIGTVSPLHKLEVDGGIMAVSSITAQGGFFGDGSGITNISAGGLPGQIEVSSIAARLDSTYGAVVLTSDTYVNGKLAAGEIFTPQSSMHVRGNLTIDNPSSVLAAALNFSLHESGDAFINWSEAAMAGSKGSLGIPTNTRDLVYRTNISGEEVFRIKGNAGGGNGWKFGIGTAQPQAAFHVAADIFIGTHTTRPVVTLSTRTAYLGISTGTAVEGMHVASSLLVGGDRASALLYVSTGTSFTGIGTGNPRALLEVGDGVVLAAGTHDGGTPAPLPVTGAGTRFMWIPKDSAIRAGAVLGTEWDTIGKYSAAFGYRNTASGSESAVLGGDFNQAAGRYSSVTGGRSNTAQGIQSIIASGQNNYMTGRDSVIPGGSYNVVMSSNAFAGGHNMYLDTPAQGTFAWGYDDFNGSGYVFNTFKLNDPYLFLIDPGNIKQYKVGVRTHTPQAALDINGDAQFGAGVTKSTFTAEGFWQPRAMTTAELQAAGGIPGAVGLVVRNSSISDLCVSTGTAVGQWALVGSKGVGDCF